MYKSWSNALWLKMDTEGLEPFIIRGGGQSIFSNSDMSPCFIKLEFMKHKEEIVDLLMRAGFDMVRMDWRSIGQKQRLTRDQAIRSGDWDAIFAKRDAEQCVRRKLESI